MKASKRYRSTALRDAATALALFGVCATLWRGEARGDGVAQVLTSKSLPPATVEVIDPESGSSSGTAGSDVNVAVGDIILFRFSFTPVPDKINRGIMGYLTEYIPANTEVVGVRFLDENGLTIEPSYPGLAVEGCAGGNLCNTFNNLPSNGGTADFSGGSIAQVHADTGIFYSTSSATAKFPADSFITMDNGIEMDPEPRTISPGIVALLNDTTGPYYAHNDWDWTQVQAYGFNMDAANVDGTGNTPYLYGSLVAGSDTYYSFEATQVSPTVIEFNDVDGPWNRIAIPGSQTGFGPAETGDGGNLRMNIPTAAGFDVTPANPIAGATAVRFALGETRTGQVKFVEVALRVTGVPIDPAFDPPNGGNVDCGEVVGSDVSARGGNSGGDNNAWPTYVGSPACVYLKLLFDLSVDKVLALGGNTLTYTIDGKNLSVDPETGVLVRLKFDGSRQSYLTSTPAPVGAPATCVDDSTKLCLSYDLGTLQPSDEYQIVAQFSVGGGGQTTNVMVANYASDQLPAPGFDTQAISVVTGIAVPLVTMGPVDDPTVTAPAAGGTADMVALVANVGTDNFTYETITLPLPTGWSINGPVTLNSSLLACIAGCGTDTPTYDISSSFVPLEVRTLEFTVNVPALAAPGLYTFDAQVWGGQSGFGGDFETYFPKIATLAVTNVRTNKPVLDCPIVSSQTSITGSSEADATVRLYFNLIQRGDGVADGAGDWSINNFGAFGELYGGLEVRATAQAPGELESALSDACFITQVRVCSDGIDNDLDGLTDFPADPGCDSPADGDETDPPLPECSDGIDNDGANGMDWPDDPSCSGPNDPTEDGVPACSDDVDNDDDGLLDFDGDGNPLNIDPDCVDANDATEVTLRACQDGIDNDSDGLLDFDGAGTPANADPGCHSLFDDDEADDNFTPADTEARLLILFDSSGSMNWNTCSPLFTDGDGSAECVGSDVSCATCGAAGCSNGIADDSRIAKVKAGISNVVAGFGEVEYGLMRFTQRGTDFSCPTQNASLNSGGWQGGGAEPCDSFNSGDLLVGFANENEQTLLGWIDGEDNYEGLPPYGTDYEIRGSGTTPLGGALSSANTYMSGVKLVDPREECRPYRVILVTDGQETCGGDPVAEAAALCNYNVTTMECDDIAVNVIGFATSDPQVNADLDAIASAGGTGAAILVDDEAALSTAIASIVTETILVEYCNGEDDDCDGFTDEDFTDLGDDCDNGEEGICFEPGNLVCTTDGFGTECDAPPGTPGTEVCNGLDDDCNGLVDDGLMNCNCGSTQEICNGLDDDCDTFVDEGPLPGNGDNCGLDIGECEYGSLSCVPDGMGGAGMECVGGTGPELETCNGLDDDCDTFVDEVVRECYTFMDGGCTLGSGCTGQCQTGLITCLPMGGGESMCVGEVGATAELCNGLDDDCDGFTDEDFPNLGDTCTNGQMGVCELSGTIQCTADQMGEECNAPTVTPGTEVCNNFDDDCDGPVDEDLGAPIGDSCGGGADCTPGMLECNNGVVECVGTMGGEAETCNGIDDDCDSFVDEEPLPGTGGECTDPGFEMYGDIGECEFGEVQCIAGGLECSGYIGPTPEICNGLDDDCDGEADQFAECPVPDNMCLDGGCAEPCNMTEFPCPFGFQCKDFDDEGRFCIPDQCVGVTCPQGFVCDSDTGECNDLCDGVECQQGQTCQGGGCFDCFTLGCADDEICVVGENNIGTCVADPCAGVECEDGEFCADGDCQPLVCVPDCPVEQICIDGQCRVDMCGDVTCPNGRICDPQTGECIGDLCQDLNCMAGFACDPGTGLCIPDPCLTIDCPEGFDCVVTLDGVGACRQPPTPADDGDYVYAAGGGCAATGGDGTVSWAFLALLGLVVIRRRKSVTR